MKKIKDLIYDYNDIFIALMILALAAMVILWRVTGIMDYSKYVNKHNPTHHSQVDFTDVDLTQTEVEEFNENPEEFNSESSGQEAEAPQEQQPAETGSEEPQPQEGGQQTATDKSIVIPAGSAGTKIAEILVQNGLIESSDQFLSAVTAKQAEKKLKAGTFTIPAGSTVDQIVDILAR
ncbi:MAG: endolytic transglycosylase MltG [Clostridia bacterium]|nr:endolytic transglycosylase MltG [Clostridia bacterium]